MWGQIPFRGICVEVPKPSLPELGVPYRDEVEQSGSTLQSSVNVNGSGHSSTDDPFKEAVAS